MGKLKLTWIHKYLLLPSNNAIFVFNSSPLECVSEHYSCLTEFRYFIHPNTLNWAQRSIETCFKEEKIKNALKGNSQWTTSQQKTDWNPGTHIKKNSSIIVERFLYIHLHAQTIHCSRSCHNICRYW